MIFNRYPKLASVSSLCIIIILFTNLAIASRDQEVNLNEEDIDLVSPDSEREAVREKTINQDEEFNHEIHPNDHSVYGQRSLMSRANIGIDLNLDENLAEEDLEVLKRKHYAEREWQLMFRAFDQMYSEASKSVLEQIGQETKIVEEVISRLKPECQREINHMRDSIRQHKLWALRMIDSYGKIPSGISYGRFASPGDYEECLSVNVDELVHRGKEGKQLVPEYHKFRGKYCLIDFRLPLPERPQEKLLSIHDPIVDLDKTEVGARFPELKNYSGYASVFYEIGYLHAFCLPSTCDVKDMTKSLEYALEGLHIIVNSTVDCQVKSDGPTKFTTAQIISLSLISILFINAAIASVMRYLIPKSVKNNQKIRGRSQQDILKEAEVQVSAVKSSFKRWLTLKALQNQSYPDCFSIQTNFERLTKPDPRGLTFVHYTRIVAMALTVITHTAGMGTLEAIIKPADASNSEQIFRDFLPQMLANAFTSIQIFFFMAGFMLVVSTYPSIKRDPTSISFLEYSVKRAIRLMPGLAATIAINFLWPLIVDGPMLAYFVRVIVVPCETTWWRTMTFLSNFDHVEKMCLRHSYFSASDYQLHMMAFPLLILLYKKPVMSLAIAGLLTIIGFAAQVIMVLTKTILPFMMVDYIDKQAFFNVVHYIHHPVWNHMSAFFYGFIIGYFVVRQIRVELSGRTIKLLWYIISPLGVASIYAPYFWNHYKRPIYKWQMVIYVIVDRFILLTTCAWLSYATMVLARPQPKPKKLSNTNTNLPNTITLEQATDKTRETNQVKDAKIADNPKKVTEVSTNSNLLHVSEVVSNLPRQRSSPNFQSLTENESIHSSPSLRPAISTSDVSLNQTQKILPVLQPAEQKKPTTPSVSNLNTLCLVLSRLTFQLYLFNMVVLWVDVIHSKYYWFFSYYFIFTKAFAVYIFSAIFATIFFVTLESPSLTLYILWVKNRAQARAHRQSKTSDEKKDQKPEQPIRINNLRSRISTNNRTSSEESQDGLHMRTGSTTENNKPSFSFIDLSTPTSTKSENQSITQTKM